MDRYVFHPLQAHRIGAHRDIADFVLITWEANPLVGSLTEHDHVAGLLL
jgi:hypothetical protein